MTITGELKRIVNRALAPLHVALIRCPAPTLDGALERLARREIAIRTVVDVGASDGSWSSRLMTVYPDANYFLVEANPQHEAALRVFCGRHRNAQYVLAAAAQSRGEIYFDDSDPLGGVASTESDSRHLLKVAATPLDLEIAERGLEGPYLLKLDTHGFEVPILDGARVLLGNAEVVMLECYNFELAPGSLRFHEMCELMGSLGFRAADMYDLLYRPGDGIFWQGDLMFLRGERPEFTLRSWA